MARAEAPTQWVETKLTASDPSNSDWFGNSAVSGERVVVGAQQKDGGSAYVYDWSGTQWVETKLQASDTTGGSFGASVSVSGDRVVVGATISDAVYVYDWDGLQWLETKIHDPVTAAFGHSVSTSGNLIAVGVRVLTPLSDAGWAYIYEWDGVQWLETKLTATDGQRGDQFGLSVSVSGNRVVVGAPSDHNPNGADSGSAYIYEWDGLQWAETKLRASDGDVGDSFGSHVSVSGDRVVIGAAGDDDNGENSGSAYLYDWDGLHWVETKLTASDGAAGDSFGSAVSVSGNRAVVGASDDDDNGTDSGSAYVYEWEWCALDGDEARGRR